MNGRRRFLHHCLAFPALLVPGLTRRAESAEVGDLRNQILVNLEPRTPAERRFLDRVIVMVQRDELPLALVLRIFQWAREKRPYPFPYFQRALTIQARRLSIVIRSTG